MNKSSDPIHVGWESGYYTAIEFTGIHRGSSRVVKFLCRACGEVYEHTIKYMQSQHPQSCGCIHGRGKQSRTVKPYDALQGTRNSFNAMRNRLRDKSRHNFYLYNGKEFYEPWRKFKNFLAYLLETGIGLRPSPEYTIDRLNGELGYIPGNIGWIKKEDQNRNQKKNLFIVHQGKRMCAAEFSRYTGIDYDRVRKCIKKGMPAEEIINHYGFLQQEMRFAA